MADEKMPLVGLAEIAKRTGRTTTAVSNWRTRCADFPVTVADLACGPVFWWPTVEEWLKDNNRL